MVGVWIAYSDSSSSMCIFLSFPFRMYYGSHIVLCVYFCHFCFRMYYGSQIAMYFAWLGFYTQFLIAPSIIGLIIFLYGTIYMTDSYPRYSLLCQPFQHLSDTFKWLNLKLRFVSPLPIDTYQWHQPPKINWVRADLGYLRSSLAYQGLWPQLGWSRLSQKQSSISRVVTTAI